MGTFGSIERTVVWDEVGDCWRDKVTGVDVKGMARPLIDGSQPWSAPSQPNNKPAGYPIGLSCLGCGYAIETTYWVSDPPTFCHRCLATFSRIANRWREHGFDQREQTHIVFCMNYAAKFAHGAPGHLDLMTIARMTVILDNPMQVLS